MRSIGLDIGARYIGVAMSDPEGVSASPFEVLKDVSGEELLSYVKEKVEQGVKLVVVGLPLDKRGEEGAQATMTRSYSHVLEGIEDIELIYWDERLTTVEAERRLRETGRSTRRRRVDAEAAAVLLQSYLDRVGREDEEVPE